MGFEPMSAPTGDLNPASEVAAALNRRTGVEPLRQHDTVLMQAR